MHCPFCGTGDTRVIDSRLANDGDQVRRRRRCASCNERFTTYEVAELSMPRVIKSNEAREPFNDTKLRAGIMRALEKRPVSIESIEAALSRIRKKILISSEREIASAIIGELVMDELRQLDEVAYVRFASVYRCFNDIDEFRNMIERLESDPSPKDAQRPSDSLPTSKL